MAVNGSFCQFANYLVKGRRRFRPVDLDRLHNDFFLPTGFHQNHWTFGKANGRLRGSAQRLCCGFCLHLGLGFCQLARIGAYPNHAGGFNHLVQRGFLECFKGHLGKFRQGFGNDGKRRGSDSSRWWLWCRTVWCAGCARGGFFWRARFQQFLRSRLFRNRGTRIAKTVGQVFGRHRSGSSRHS